MSTVIYKFLNFNMFSNMSNWSVRKNVMLSTAFLNVEKTKLSKLINRVKKVVVIEDKTKYKRVTIKLYGKGVILRDIEIGENIGTKRQFIVEAGQFILSRIDARNGAFGIVPDDLSGAIITNDFWVFNISPTVNPQYLFLLLSSERLQSFWGNQSSGATNRQRIEEANFLDLDIFLPPFEIQQNIVGNYNDLLYKEKKLQIEAEKLEKSIDDVLFEELGIEENYNISNNNCFIKVISFKELYQWGVDKNTATQKYSYNKYNPVTLHNKESYIEGLFRGKSPKYSEESNKIILNQKCNRWNKIELEHAKTVDEKWLKKIDKIFSTQENDIIINSTGEGTLGRATCITKDYCGLLIDSHILLLRLKTCLNNPLFLTYQFNNKYVQSQIEQLKSAQATKQTELGIDNLKKIQFVLPSLEIQKQVADKIFALEDKIKTLRHKAESLKKQAKNEFEECVFGEN